MNTENAPAIVSAVFVLIWLIKDHKSSLVAIVEKIFSFMTIDELKNLADTLAHKINGVFVSAAAEMESTEAVAPEPSSEEVIEKGLLIAPPPMPEEKYIVAIYNDYRKEVDFDVLGVFPSKETALARVKSLIGEFDEKDGDVTAVVKQLCGRVMPIAETARSENVEAGGEYSQKIFDLSCGEDFGAYQRVCILKLKNKPVDPPLAAEEIDAEDPVNIHQNPSALPKEEEKDAPSVPLKPYGKREFIAKKNKEIEKHLSDRFLALLAEGEIFADVDRAYAANIIQLAYPKFCYPTKDCWHSGTLSPFDLSSTGNAYADIAQFLLNAIEEDRDESWEDRIYAAKYHAHIYFNMTCFEGDNGLALFFLDGGKAVPLFKKVAETTGAQTGSYAKMPEWEGIISALEKGEIVTRTPSSIFRKQDEEGSSWYVFGFEENESPEFDTDNPYIGLYCKALITVFQDEEVRVADRLYAAKYYNFLVDCQEKFEEDGLGAGLVDGVRILKLLEGRIKTFAPDQKKECAEIKDLIKNEGKRRLLPLVEAETTVRRLVDSMDAAKLAEFYESDNIRDEDIIDAESIPSESDGEEKEIIFSDADEDEEEEEGSEDGECSDEEDGDEECACGVCVECVGGEEGEEEEEGSDNEEEAPEEEEEAEAESKPLPTWAKKSTIKKVIVTPLTKFVKRINRLLGEDEASVIEKEDRIVLVLGEDAYNIRAGNTKFIDYDGKTYSVFFQDGQWQVQD